MAYADYTKYAALGGTLTTQEWESVYFEAERIIDNLTVGIDGYRKLANAYPTDEYAVKSVCLAVGKVCELLNARNKAFNNVLTNGVINSKNSGSESISYGANPQLQISVQDCNNVARSYLGGIKDKNGVNLLYMGAYPNV